MQNFQGEFKAPLTLHYNLGIPQTKHRMLSFVKYAGIAQLVERNLAKVEVASSNLVSRSKYAKVSQHLSANRKVVTVPFFSPST